MFKQLDEDKKYYLYLGLKRLLESGDGTGFHNCDPGHPIYTEGASNTTSAISASQDSPDTNRLFQMLQALSGELRDSYAAQESGWYDFADWQAFCQFAVDAYHKARS